MERFKLAYIGAGSFRFSLGFFRNIVNAVKLLPMEVALCDIDKESLDIMDKILRKMIIKASKRKKYDPSQIKVTKSIDQREVLENADYVYKSISVGLQQAEWYDNYLPLKFGIPQNTGDTVGPGGLFRSLRTNHIAASIAKDMQKLCPKATLLNYTNPQGSITMAARTVAPNIQYIGLCHELFGGGATLQAFLALYGHKFVSWWDKIDLEYAGINHFAWITKFEYKGRDFYPLLLQKATKLEKKKFLNHGFNFHLLKKYNLFPYPGSRHVVEFMVNYYNYFNYQIQSPYWKFPIIRDVSKLDEERKKKYKKFKAMAQGRKNVPGPIKFGEHAIEMTLDWRDNNPRQHVVNIPNIHPNYHKIVPELPDDCIVEVPAYFKDRQILPIKSIHLPSSIVELIVPHALQQRFVVDASLGNKFDLVAKAMFHDPMANWIENEDKLEYLTKLMLYYEKEWLPEAWQDWIPKLSELKNSRWWVSPQELSKKNQAYRNILFPPEKDLKKKAFI